MKAACPYPLPRTDWSNVKMGNPPFGEWSHPVEQTLWAAREASKRWAAAKANGQWRHVTTPKELWHQPNPARISDCLWLVVFGVVHQWNQSEGEKLVNSGQKPLSEKEWLKQIDHMIDVVFQIAQGYLLLANVPKSSIMDASKVKERCYSAMCMCYTPYRDADVMGLAKTLVIPPTTLGDLHTKYITTNARPTTYKVCTFNGDDQEEAPTIRKVTTVQPQPVASHQVTTSFKGKFSAAVPAKSAKKDVFSATPPPRIVTPSQSRSPTPLAGSSRTPVALGVSSNTPTPTPDNRRRQQPSRTTTQAPAGSLTSRMGTPTPANTHPLRPSPHILPNSSPVVSQWRPVTSGPRGNEENAPSTRRRPPTPTSTKPNKRR